MREILAPELEAPATQAAETMDLCEHCLGRCFARVDFGLGNDERGRMLAEQWGLETVPPSTCQLCDGLFDRVEKMTEVVEHALDPIGFETFLVGVRVDPAIEDRDESLWAAIGAEETESITSELNREIGKRLDAKHDDWEVEFETPDVTAVIDTRFDHVAFTYRSLFIYGRYRKKTRGLPQTKWPCRRCKGTGCTRCGSTGRQYLITVEDFVEQSGLEASGATEAKFHGAGREDVDALCLGTGRPFVLELVDPRKRDLDLDALQEAINRGGEPAVDVGGLKFVEKDAVKLVKQASGGKAYEADVAFTDPVPGETLLKACHMLEAAPVAQRTPSRVSHRRADKVRHREVARCRVRSRDDDGLHARLLIEGEAGLYIKELINGDGGRTTPNLADEVGTEAVCEALDVVEVEGPPGLDDERSYPPTE